MKVSTNGNELVLTFEDGDHVMVTTPPASGKVAVYLSASSGRLTFTGGADIVEEISGEGMLAKVKD